MLIASPENGADNALLNAYLKQSGIERNVREFERRELPKKLRVTAGYVAFVAKAAIDRKITIQWSF